MRLCSTLWRSLCESKLCRVLKTDSDEWSSLPPEIIIDDDMGNCGTTQQTQLSSEVLWEKKWAENTKEILENPIYKYLDISGGGKLIDTYEKEGVKAVLTMIRNEISLFLYKDGQGLDLSGSEIIDRPTSKYAVPNDNSLDTTTVIDKKQISKKSPRRCCGPDAAMYSRAAKVYGTTEKLLICWDISKRGIFGETLLHLCFVCNTPAHRHLAKLMLSVFPNLVKDIFIGWEYFGQTALHMAIVNKDFEMVKLLVAYNSDIHRRAVGDFFMPDDQRKSKRAPITNFNGPSYFGEYPLFFAACSGSADIYDYLISCGADPNMTDIFGNNVLHMLVIHSKTEIYRFVLRHHKKPADHKTLNVYGLSPVTLSAKLGRRDVFNEIIDLSAAEIWRFSNITSKVYPLTGLDSIGSSGRTDWDSAFLYIINGTTNDHLDMLEEGVIGQLLSEKWHKYAKARFFQRLILLIAHLAIMSMAVYLRPIMATTSSTTTYVNFTSTSTTTATSNVKDIFRYIFEAITVFNSFLTLCLHIDEVREQGILDFVKGLRHAPPKASFLIGCFLISLALPANIASIFWTSQKVTLQMIEEILLIIALPSVWFYLLFFAGGTQLNGTFVTMIYKMIRGDIVRFGIIYTIILVCFAQAYYFLFQDIEQKTISSFSHPHVTVMTLFQMTLGEFKYDEFNYTRYVPLAKMVFAMFMVLVPILLLNMLIAMMGNTYQLVTSRSRKEWTSMWAKIVLILERSYSPKKLLQYKSEYAIPMPGKDNEVGLMVIYRTKKTLAKQRRTAFNNWKRSCRKVMALIRDHKNLGNTQPFTFDGSEESLMTIRQQKAKLINFKKKASQTQRFGQILKKMETTAFSKTLKTIDDQHLESLQPEKLQESIDEILETVPTKDTSSDAEGQKEKKVNPLTNPAFRILINASPQRKQAMKRPQLTNQSSFDTSDENPLILRRSSTIERSDSAGSSKTLITNVHSPPTDSSSQDSDPHRALINMQDLTSSSPNLSRSKNDSASKPRGKSPSVGSKK